MGAVQSSQQDVAQVSWVRYIPGMYYTDPAQLLVLAGRELDDLSVDDIFELLSVCGYE